MGTSWGSRPLTHDRVEMLSFIGTSDCDPGTRQQVTALRGIRLGPDRHVSVVRTLRANGQWHVSRSMAVPREPPSYALTTESHGSDAYRKMLDMIDRVAVSSCHFSVMS